jgi:hypothetical protein
VSITSSSGRCTPGSEARHPAQLSSLRTRNPSQP